MFGKAVLQVTGNPVRTYARRLFLSTRLSAAGTVTSYATRNPNSTPHLVDTDHVLRAYAGHVDDVRTAARGHTFGIQKQGFRGYRGGTNKSPQVPEAPPFPSLESIFSRRSA